MTVYSKEQYLLRVAFAVASRSVCRRQVGCVLADRRGRILATGYNGPPSGVSHCDERGCRNDSCNDGCVHSCIPGQCDAVHAEQNALLQCKDPDAVHYAVVTRSPCMSCLKLIMNSGCKEIYFNEPSSYPEPEQYWMRRWLLYDGVWQRPTWRQLGVKL